MENRQYNNNVKLNILTKKNSRINITKIQIEIIKMTKIKDQCHQIIVIWDHME